MATESDALSYRRRYRGQVGVVRLAVIGLIARGFTGAAIYQGWQLRAVMHIAGAGLDPHHKLRIGVLHLMGLIALERLFLVLPAKMGVRVRGVPVEIMAVIVPLILNSYAPFANETDRPGR